MDIPQEQKPKKPSTKDSENARAVAREVIDSVRKGKKINKGKIILNHGYAPSMAKIPGKVTNTKSYKDEIDGFVQKMIEERDAVILLMSKRRKGAKYNHLTDSLDKLTKNIQLLTGGDTSRDRGKVVDLFAEMRDFMKQLNEEDDMPTE